jgi:HD-like signal output (HDOD) protein
MNPRRAITDAQLPALYGELDRLLDRIGIESQPHVAAKLLKLVSDPGAGLRSYADVIKADAPLAGRLLRVANSAFFAQREPVTTLERAAVLLGLERLRSISLGFYLSRAAAGDPSQILARRVWGHSIFRACLAAELARQLAPDHVAEAYVIGLMLDAGLPLLLKLQGEPCAQILRQHLTPGRQFAAETDTLPYTHVDLITVLARRWRLPDLLAAPLQRHHERPPDDAPAGTLQALQRVAYCAGAIHLDNDLTERPSPADAAPAVMRLLGLSPDALQDAVRRACAEYGVTFQLFSQFADPIADSAELADRAHRQLIAAVDAAVTDDLRHHTRLAPQRFRIGESNLEVEPDPATEGNAIAYLTDARGRRLVSHRFLARQQSLQSMLDALGIHNAPAAHLAGLEIYLRALAA